MYKLTIVNSSNKSYTITQKNDIKMDYLDGFYSSSATISTTKIGLRDGALVTGRTADKRNLGIYFYIESNVLDNRIELYDIFRVKEKVTIYYENDARKVKIEAYVEDINIKPHSNPATGQIVLVSEDAYFSDIEEIIRTIKLLEDNFVFPFSIEKEGKPFSWIKESSIQIIDNTEAVPTGMLIVLRKINNNGPNISNPTITKLETNETFSPGTAINNDQTIYIDTTKKTVYKYDSFYDENTNLFNRIEKGSKWLQLTPGLNTFIINTENGTGLENLEVEIIYTKKYQGV